MAFRLARILRAVAATALTLVVGVAVSGANTTGEVRVSARVGAVARAKGPASIELKPGESSTVTIQIAANFPWKLSLGGTNPSISMNPGEMKGRPGGFATEGNTIQVHFSCDPDASGTQSCEIQYLIERS